MSGGCARWLPRREIAPVRLSEHDDVEMRRMMFLRRVDHPLRFQRQQRVAQPREAFALWTVQVQRNARRMHRQGRAVRRLPPRRTNGARDLEWRAACLMILAGQALDEHPRGGRDVRIAHAMQRVVTVGLEPHQVTVANRPPYVGRAPVEIEIVVPGVCVGVLDARVRPVQ